MSRGHNSTGIALDISDKKRNGRNFTQVKPVNLHTTRITDCLVVLKSISWIFPIIASLSANFDRSYGSRVCLFESCAIAQTFSRVRIPVIRRVLLLINRPMVEIMYWVVTLWEEFTLFLYLGLAPLICPQRNFAHTSRYINKAECARILRSSHRLFTLLSKPLDMSRECVSQTFHGSICTKCVLKSCLELIYNYSIRTMFSCNYTMSFTLL